MGSDVMPDITMCLSTNCTRAEECWRHTAVPDRLQSYSDFTDQIDEDGRCMYFWSNR